MRIFLAALGFCCLILLATSVSAEPLTPGAVADQETVELKRRVTELEAEVTRLQAQRDQYQYLKEETQQYRQFIERERDESRRFLEDLFKYVSVAVACLVAVGGALATFVGIRTVNDVRSRIQKSSVEKLNEIQGMAIAEVGAAVESQIAGVRDDMVSALTELHRNQQWYKRAHVLAVGREADLLPMVKPALSRLEQRGLRVDLAPYPMTGVADRIRNGEINIVIFRYGAARGQRDPHLPDVVDMLRNIGKPVSLLVYNETRVDDADDALIRSYEWSTYANSNVTLIGNLFQLAHVFA